MALRSFNPDDYVNTHSQLERNFCKQSFLQQETRPLVLGERKEIGIHLPTMLHFIKSPNCKVS